MKIKNSVRDFVLFFDRFHWLWLILAAPFLVVPSPKRSLSLLVVPFLWILYLSRGRIESRKLKMENMTIGSEGLDIDYGFPVTPLNVSLLVLVIMLLVSLWATYSIEQSLEKISGLVLGMGIFFTMVRESRKPSGWWWILAAFLGGGLCWALLGFLGMNYQVRFSLLEPVISRIPVIVKDLPGAESGLQHNAVGGTLLWIFPMLLVLSWFVMTARRSHLPELVSGITGSDGEQAASTLTLIQRFCGWLRRVAGHRSMIWVIRFTLWITTLFVGIVLLLTQSRGSYLALGITVLGILFLVVPKRRRWILLVLVILFFIGASVFIVQAGGWEGFVDQLGLSTESGLSLETLGARQEIWSRAICGVQDFPFTGMGMNTFRDVVHVFYPLFTISPNFDVAHAHNEFLQAALDLGIPGLIAFISIYIISLWMLFKIWKHPQSEEINAEDHLLHQRKLLLNDRGIQRVMGLGLGGGLFGHLIFGMTDAITLGAKPGIFYWMLLGLITGLYQLTEEEVKVVEER